MKKLSNFKKLPMKQVIFAGIMFGAFFTLIYLDSKQKQSMHSELLENGIITNDCHIFDKWNWLDKAQDITDYYFECNFEKYQLQGNFSIFHKSSFHKITQEFNIGDTVSILYSALNPSIHSIIKINNQNTIISINQNNINNILYTRREAMPFMFYRVITGKLPNQPIFLDLELIKLVDFK